MADTPPAGAPPVDPPETPPGAPSAPVPPAGPPPDPTDPVDGDPPEIASLRREAAGYRTRLRDTETERDQLRTRVDHLERAEVERLAANAGMSTPADLWLIVTDLEQLRVDGHVSTDRVTERVQAILRERPSWRAARPDWGSGSRIGNAPPGSREPGLMDLVEQHRRRDARRLA